MGFRLPLDLLPAHAQTKLQHSMNATTCARFPLTVFSVNNVSVKFTETTPVCHLSSSSSLSASINQTPKTNEKHHCRDFNLGVIIFLSNACGARAKRRRRGLFSSLQSRPPQWGAPPPPPLRVKVTTTKQWERLTFTQAHKKEKKKTLSNSYSSPQRSHLQVKEGRDRHNQRPL